MAYNSDGYIMLDFTEVDFRRTNQTIDGLFKRCVDVIGTNKFILVINANGRTPLPATCSFTNNQYVIDTVIYMFAVSSNDNLFIRRNDVPASDIIDDSSISVDKTWSSNKIDSELDGKQNTLTAASPISISEDDEISVDLSGKQNVLTAGNNITINDDVISADGVKSFTYTGNGSYSNNIITFATPPKLILSISGIDSATDYAYSTEGSFAMDYYAIGVTQFRSTGRTSNLSFMEKLSDTQLRIRHATPTAGFALNSNGDKYTVYYI